MTEPTQTRLLVTGGRDFADRDLLYATLDRLHAEHNIIVVIHGDAKGADRLAGEWASVLWPESCRGSV